MDLIYSQDKGPNRRIYFGLMGVEAQGYENLSSELFCKLLGHIAGTYDNPKFDGIRYIRVSSEHPLDQIETTDNGETRIVIAMRMLWNEKNVYVPKRIDMNPILPSPPPPKPIEN